MQAGPISFMPAFKEAVAGVLAEVATRATWKRNIPGAP